MNTTLDHTRRAGRRALGSAKRLLCGAIPSLGFALRHRGARGRPKILYALTPPPQLANVGDHAQVVAIRRWLSTHFADLPVIEVDKRQSVLLLPALRWLLGPDDLILLHSGGNLGDRGLMSESARRGIIGSFPRNRIVSLPQTIFFSASDRGRRERRTSEAIYRRHPALTVIGRDPVSGELAAEMFPTATTFSMPDFVLSLPPRDGDRLAVDVLLCLRNDSESALDAAARAALIASIPDSWRLYDTTLPEPIAVDRREAILDATLDLFASARAVVTDRYHGLIFSVLCGKPTVVLPTVDHKLTSAISWFEGLPFVRFVDRPDAVPAALAAVRRADSFERPDWSGLYFDQLAARVREGVPA